MNFKLLIILFLISNSALCEDRSSREGGFFIYASDHPKARSLKETGEYYPRNLPFEGNTKREKEFNQEILNTYNYVASANVSLEETQKLYLSSFRDFQTYCNKLEKAGDTVVNIIGYTFWGLANSIVNVPKHFNLIEGEKKPWLWQSIKMGARARNEYCRMRFFQVNTLKIQLAEKGQVFRKHTTTKEQLKKLEQNLKSHFSINDRNRPNVLTNPNAGDPTEQRNTNNTSIESN